MTDRFDELLSRELSQLPPPESVVQDTNPWRRSLEFILIGQVLSMLRLDLYRLDYLLPAIGYVYLLLGHRILRRENAALKAGWALAILRAVLFGIKLCLDASFLSTQESVLSDVLDYLHLALTLLGLVHLLCLHVTVDALWKCGPPPRWRWVLHGILLLALPVGLAVPAVLSWTSVLLLLLTVSELLQLGRSLSDAGFTMDAAPVRLSNRAFTVLTVSITVAAVMICGTALRKAPMDFAPAEGENTAQVAAIEAQLVELGVPADIVADLSDADVLRCQDATRVELADTQYQEDLNARVTVIAIQVPPVLHSDACWVILSHFRFTEAPLFSGTDAISSRHDVVSGSRWWIEREENASGRVLYDWDGVTQTSEFYDITYSMDYDRLIQTAYFSFPGGGENYRGYLMYTALLVNNGCILNVVSTLTHQTLMPCYPAQAPAPEEHTLTFLENQSQLQFFPEKEE